MQCSVLSSIKLLWWFLLGGSDIYTILTLYSWKPVLGVCLGHRDCILQWSVPVVSFQVNQSLAIGVMWCCLLQYFVLVLYSQPVINLLLSYYLLPWIGLSKVDKGRRLSLVCTFFFCRKALLFTQYIWHATGGRIIKWRKQTFKHPKWFLNGLWE